MVSHHSDTHTPRPFLLPHLSGRGEWAALQHHLQTPLSALSATLEPAEEKTQVLTRPARSACV